MKSVTYWYPESYEKVFEDSIKDSDVLPTMIKFAQKNLMEKAKEAKNILDREFIPIDGVNKKLDEKILDKIKVIHCGVETVKPYTTYKKMKINLGLFVHQYLNYYYKIGVFIKPNGEAFENIVQGILDAAFVQEISRLNEVFFNSQKDTEDTPDDTKIEEEPASS